MNLEKFKHPKTHPNCRTAHFLPGLMGRLKGSFEEAEIWSSPEVLLWTSPVARSPRIKRRSFENEPLAMAPFAFCVSGRARPFRIQAKLRLQPPQMLMPAEGRHGI